MIRITIQVKQEDLNTSMSFSFRQSEILNKRIIIIIIFFCIEAELQLIKSKKMIETLKEKQEVLNVHEQVFYSHHSRIERDKLYNLLVLHFIFLYLLLLVQKL